MARRLLCQPRADARDSGHPGAHCHEVPGSQSGAMCSHVLTACVFSFVSFSCVFRSAVNGSMAVCTSPIGSGLVRRKREKDTNRHEARWPLLPDLQRLQVEGG